VNLSMNNFWPVTSWPTKQTPTTLSAMSRLEQAFTIRITAAFSTCVPNVLSLISTFCSSSPDTKPRKTFNTNIQTEATRSPCHRLQLKLKKLQVLFVVENFRHWWLVTKRWESKRMVWISWKRVWAQFLSSKPMGFQAFVGLSWSFLIYLVSFSPLISNFEHGHFTLAQNHWEREDWWSSEYFELWINACQLRVLNS
jgi:hypothetical protein